jgi:hypothetical protein
MFYGIIIRMYCAPAEHNPPHIHAYYQDYKAIIDIQQCEITEGSLLLSITHNFTKTFTLPHL